MGKPISFDDENHGSRYVRPIRCKQSLEWFWCGSFLMSGLSSQSQGFSPGHNTLKLELDARMFRNFGPMVNDDRGTGSTANLKPVHGYWKVGGRGVGPGFPLIVLVATRPIKQGEELLWDYGEKYWEDFVPGGEVASSDDDGDGVVMSSQQSFDDSDGSESQVF